MHLCLTAVCKANWPTGTLKFYSTSAQNWKLNSHASITSWHKHPKFQLWRLKYIYKLYHTPVIKLRMTLITRNRKKKIILRLLWLIIWYNSCNMSENDHIWIQCFIFFETTELLKSRWLVGQAVCSAPQYFIITHDVTHSTFCKKLHAASMIWILNMTILQS